MIAGVPEIAQGVKKDALWAKDLIESNKLYEINFDMSTE